MTAKAPISQRQFLTQVKATRNILRNVVHNWIIGTTKESDIEGCLLVALSYLPDDNVPIDFLGGRKYLRSINAGPFEKATRERLKKFVAETDLAMKLAQNSTPETEKTRAEETVAKEKPDSQPVPEAPEAQEKELRGESSPAREEVEPDAPKPHPTVADMAIALKEKWEGEKTVGPVEYPDDVPVVASSPASAGTVGKKEEKDEPVTHEDVPASRDNRTEDPDPITFSEFTSLFFSSLPNLSTYDFAKRYGLKESEVWAVMSNPKATCAIRLSPAKAEKEAIRARKEFPALSNRDIESLFGVSLEQDKGQVKEKGEEPVVKPEVRTVPTPAPAPAKPKPKKEKVLPVRASMGKKIHRYVGDHPDMSDDELGVVFSLSPETIRQVIDFFSA